MALRGASYGGNNILLYAQKDPACVFAVNAQVALCSPFSQRQESFDEAAMLAGLQIVFDAARTACQKNSAAVLVVQIARGKSAPAFAQKIQHLCNPAESANALYQAWTEGSDPASGHVYFYNTITCKSSWVKPPPPVSDGLQVRVTHGYKTTEYFEHPSEKFAFVNVGFFVLLDAGETPNGVLGQVCLPSGTWCIETKVEDAKEVEPVKSHLALTPRSAGRRFTQLSQRTQHAVIESNNHMASFDNYPVELQGLSKCELLALTDSMPRVTPQNRYTLADLRPLFEYLAPKRFSIPDSPAPPTSSPPTSPALHSSQPQQRVQTQTFATETQSVLTPQSLNPIKTQSTLQSPSPLPKENKSTTVQSPRGSRGSAGSSSFDLFISVTPTPPGKPM